MPQNDFTFWAALGNFGAMILAGLGLKGRLDSLSKAVVYKDTCKVCGNSISKELKTLREDQKAHYAELMALLIIVHQSLPKRNND